jgi:hypothetical protein
MNDKYKFKLLLVRAQRGRGTQAAFGALRIRDRNNEISNQRLINCVFCDGLNSQIL